MMQEDVRKRGMLYQHQHRFGKKWKKAWCVLLADSSHSAARLELHEFRQASVNEGNSLKRSESKKVVLLRDCVQISETDAGQAPKNCSTFQLETTNKLFTFAGYQPDVQSWVTELCQLAFPLNQAETRFSGQGKIPHHPVRDHSSVEMKENCLYETTTNARDFLVIAMGSDAAVRCNLYGEYILTPTDDAILLKDHKTKQVLLSWPYCFIRKFGQDRLSFSFEAGRRCQTGEGNFEFTTNNSDRIFKIVSTAIQQLPQGNKPRNQEQAEPVPVPVFEDGCVYSTVNHMPPDGTAQDGQFPSGPKKHPLKKLTPSFRSLSLNAIDPPTKGQVRNMNSCPSSTFTPTPKEPQVPQEPQEPLYASISKPRGQNESKPDHKAWPGLHQVLSLVDQNMGYSQEEEPRGALQSDLVELSMDLQPDDEIPEAIYAEPEEYEPRVPWEAICHPLEEIGDDEEAERSVEEQEDGLSTYDNLMNRGKRH